MAQKPWAITDKFHTNQHKKTLSKPLGMPLREL